MNERYRSLEKRVELLEARLNKCNKHRTFEANDDGATVLYEDPEWTVYRITTYKAALKYGRSTDWGIAERRRNGEQVFADTIRNRNLDGGFYFYINKNDPRKKYCVLQSKDGKIKSIWDALDEPMEYLDVDLPVVDGVNLSGIGGSDQLLKAVDDGDTATVKKLLKSGVDPSVESYQGTPAICSAAMKLAYPIVKLLLKAGADPNAYDPRNGVTPLAAAITGLNSSSAKDNTVKELLVNGAKVSLKDVGHLCANGNLKLVKLILDNTNLKPTSDLLWNASRFMTDGNLEVIEYLLEIGIDPNVPDMYGETLLQRALRWDQKNARVAKYVSLLKEHGAEE